MSLSSDSAVLTMPVQPANTNGGNGFGIAQTLYEQMKRNYSV